MSSPEGKPASKISAQTLDWQICEDERDWDLAQSQSAASNPAEMQTRRWMRSKLIHLSVLTACVVLSLALLGGWIWQRAQIGLAEVESELEAEIVAELWSSRKSHVPADAGEARLARRMELQNNLGEIFTDVTIRDLGSNWAVVEVLMQLTMDGPNYRQTRVYHDTGSGWVRGEIIAAYWGAVRQLESEYFVIHYRALDEAAVVQAAPQLDALYLELHNILHPEMAVGEKLTVTIDPEYHFRIPDRPSDPQASISNPKFDFAVLDYPSSPQASIVVASPSATLAPAALAASDLLLQSIVLEMFNRLTFDTAANQNLPISWFKAHRSLRLWFIWEHDLPLAVWRKPLVKWLVEAAEDTARQRRSDVPAFAEELCLHHSLWMRSPLHAGVPILCWDRYPGDEKVDVWSSHKTITEIFPVSLLFFTPVTSSASNIWQEIQPWQEPYTVILATVFEYAASRYGSERIPLLLAALREHTRGRTLIPAVFDVSLAEFESGWREYVIEHYEINQ